MRTLMMTILVATLAGSAGCLGDLDPGQAKPDAKPPEPTPDGNTNPNPPSARELFDKDVVKLLNDKRCVGCHTGNGGILFLGTDRAKYYDKIVANKDLTGDFDPTKAKLITYTHTSPGTPVPLWNGDEKAKVTAWMDAETKAKTGK